MSPDEAAAQLAAQIQSMIAEQTGPTIGRITALISGHGIAIALLARMLEEKGVLSRPEYAARLELTAEQISKAENVDPARRPATVAGLQSIATTIRGMIAAEMQGRPLDVRSVLRVLPGGLSGQSPDDKDRQGAPDHIPTSPPSPDEAG